MEPLTIKLRLDHDTAVQLQSQKPRSLPLATFCALLIEQALDMPVNLGGPSAAGTPSKAVNSSLPKSINSSKSKKEGKKQTIYPEAFEAFWKAYQVLPEKASKQSKPLALQAWNEACELHTADDLQRAVERQLQIQTDELNSPRGFTVAMPDCFRWLRDECFVALLEGHKPAETYTPTYTVL